MHVEDFSKHFTCIDCSEYWHPLDHLDEDGETTGLTSLQLTGLLTKEKSFGEACWWRNPRFCLTLEEGRTRVTITQNQLNTKATHPTSPGSSDPCEAEGRGFRKREDSGEWVLGLTNDGYLHVYHRPSLGVKCREIVVCTHEICARITRTLRFYKKSS